MEPIEIDACLESMVILYDTREQPTDRARRRYSQFRCPAVRQHLSYGDYTYNFQLPDGRWIYETGDDVVVDPVVSIERKADLTELSQNLIQNKARFESEFQRASDHQCRIYLLIENGNMENIYNGRYGTKVNPNAYKGSLWAIVSRYEICGPIFCKQEIAGKVIKDILYRELKERLERGDYD